MDTLTDTQKPKCVGAVMAILGMWLKETSDDLTEAERIRAKFHCRKRLREARIRYGGTPPIQALLDIDDAVILDILAHRASMQTLRRTHPLYVSDMARETQDEPPGVDNSEVDCEETKDSNATVGQAKSRHGESAASVEFTDVHDALRKTLERVRKASHAVASHVEATPEASQNGPAPILSPEAQTTANNDDELMHESHHAAPESSDAPNEGLKPSTLQCAA